MHTDARLLDNDSLIEGDLCIVGAGAAGITMALEWLNTPRKVILLEGGGFEYDDKVQELYRGKTTGQPYYPLKSTRLHYFGGTTGHWGGFCSILDPIDFVKRDWVNESGWPMAQPDIVPFYKRAHEYLDLGHYDYTAAYWQEQNPDFVPLPLNEQIVWNKIWRFSPPTHFGAKYRDTVVNAPNIALYTYANLVDIRATDNVSAIREVIVRNHAGKTHRVRARYFVLACCAIQNARILLAANRQAARGLGNDRDLVGRYFMEHIEVKSAELWLNHPNALNFYLLNSRARVELAISARKQEECRILNGTASLQPLATARKLKPVIETWSNDDPRESQQVMRADQDRAVGSRISRMLRSNRHRAFELATRMEQAPNPESRVSLDTEKDELGVPRAMLHWALAPLDKRSIRKLYELIGQEMGAAGIGRVQVMEYLRDEHDDSWPPFTGGAWHHMGTTRMSEDPAKGVVDPDCRVFGIENLFIAGSSCFPTSGAVNPTLTLVALALRLADHLKGKLTNDPIHA
jgi:choline dehydrogenase-like flavoprotein